MMTNDTFAVVFPGQGSQCVGMLADIAAQFNEVEQTFAEASSALGYDLWHLVANGPAEELDKTMHTQPALLSASYAIWRILETRIETKPTLLAGHSLGEYTALVCAKSLSFADAVKLVAARGQYMQDAVLPGEGAMAAIIGLDEASVVSICQAALSSTTEVLAPANYNSIGQIVLAGSKPAVLRAIALAKEQGAKMAVLIPVSVPSHCALMRPAADRLMALLATVSLQLPQIPVINNADVARYESVDAIRAGLVKQLYMPVRWVEIIQYFIRAGINQMIECGPGKVLTGLNKRIDKNLQLITTTDASSLDNLLKMESERRAS